MSTYPGPATLMKCPVCDQEIVLEIIRGAGASCPGPFAGFKGFHKCAEVTIEIFGTRKGYEDLFDNPGTEKPGTKRSIPNSERRKNEYSGYATTYCDDRLRAMRKKDVLRKGSEDRRKP